MDDSADITVSDCTTLDARPIEKQPCQPIVWRNVILYSLIHLGALYGVYLAFVSAKIATTVFAICLYQITSISVTAGSHRLWSNREPRAKWQLRLIIITLNTIAFQFTSGPAITDYTTSSQTRIRIRIEDCSFRTSVGYYCAGKIQMLSRSHTIDTSDLLADPFVAYQKKYFWFLITWACFIIPTLIPVYCWGETWSNSWYVAVLLRYALTLNGVRLIDSAAHAWEGKPYDRTIKPTGNLAVSEGWHNYHHVFPRDYKAAELGNYKFNFTTAFIDLFAKVGRMYDLNTAPTPELVLRRPWRPGQIKYRTDPAPQSWCWDDDKDFPRLECKEATIVNCRMWG